MTNPSSEAPLISVVIPTHERAALLARSLGSLTAQTLAPSQFEVVVVDDGSSDNTEEVCGGFAGQLALRYLRIENSGTSAAKNLGLFASRAALVLFFDDDDLADPGLLEAHIEAHRAHPEESVAVLGYTTWSDELEVTPLMEYVTEIGHLLFAYRTIEDGQMLDFTYFWAGRLSCKRAFLAQHDTFDQGFHAAGIEDIELGFRLAEHGLSVFHTRAAKSFMARSIDFEGFARRCVVRGRALWLFNSRHSDPAVRRYCAVADALERWPVLAPSLEAKMERVRELERSHSEQGELASSELSELRDLYRWTFDALQARGVAEAAAEASETALAGPPVRAAGTAPGPAICREPVFVIGSPRSGTTALAVALAEHSELWTSGESYFLFFLLNDGLVERAFERAMEVPGPRWLRVAEVSEEEFSASVGIGMNALITSRSEGRRWIDHTPLYTLIVDRLAKLFPGAKFVHILRDGREVVNSMLNFTSSHPDPETARFAQRTMAWSRDIRSACEAWREHVEPAMAFCDEHPDRAIVVRHEELVATPAEALANVHRFLGIADEAGPARLLAAKQINSSFAGKRRLSAAEIWDGWNEDERQVFGEVAGPSMVRCGFSIPVDEVGSEAPLR
jgi:GT2 family glycosyltransferase